MDAVKAAKERNVRVSIVGVAAEVHICRVFTKVGIAHSLTASISGSLCNEWPRGIIEALRANFKCQWVRSFEGLDRGCAAGDEGRVRDRAQREAL